MLFLSDSPVSSFLLSSIITVFITLSICMISPGEVFCAYACAGTLPLSHIAMEIGSLIRELPAEAEDSSLCVISQQTAAIKNQTYKIQENKKHPKLRYPNTKKKRLPMHEMPNKTEEFEELIEEYRTPYLPIVRRGENVESMEGYSEEFGFPPLSDPIKGETIPGGRLKEFAVHDEEGYLTFFGYTGHDKDGQLVFTITVEPQRDGGYISTLKTPSDETAWITEVDKDGMTVRDEKLLFQEGRQEFRDENGEINKICVNTRNGEYREKEFIYESKHARLFTIEGSADEHVSLPGDRPDNEDIPAIITYDTEKGMVTIDVDPSSGISAIEIAKEMWPDAEGDEKTAYSTELPPAEAVRAVEKAEKAIEPCTTFKRAEELSEIVSSTAIELENVIGEKEIPYSKDFGESSRG